MTPRPFGARFAGLVDRPVPGFDGLTIGALMQAVAAARRASQGPLNVHRFLADRGHEWQTVECVLAYLAMADDDASLTVAAAS